MKILKLYLSYLRNAEHFLFMTRFLNLFTLFPPSVLKIGKLVERFRILYQQEDECLVLLQKSSYTKLMYELDEKRDGLFRGLVNFVITNLNHFKAEVRLAANRLKILFDTYGNLAQKPDKEETSGIINLTQDLESKFAADIELIGATEWVAELKACNLEYAELEENRYQERGEKPEVKLKQIRMEIDAAYRDITRAVEALATLADTPVEIAKYKAFINDLNILVEDYRNTLALRQGIAKAKKDKKDENPEIVTSED